MSQTIILKAKGLHTNENQLSEVPEGSLSQATNVVINSDSIIESRRGFEVVSNSFSSSSNRADRLTSYQSKLIARRSDDSKLSYHDGTNWNDYTGTYSHPDSDYARMKFVEMNGNLYFTTSNGVYMLDAYNSSIYSTGMPKGLDGSASLSGASGFMTNNTQVAYRIVWGTRDANDNLYLGAPSQRIIVSNSSGGTRDVSLTFTIPSGITTSDFFQVYRSGMSASSTSEPNDELQLVYEENPTAGEITALSVTVTDSTPDSLRGAYLYTNSNQEGITEENNKPPFAKDITTFKNFMFFSSPKTSHSIDVDLLAVSGSAGLALNDTITIDSMVFTAKAAETVASKEFLLSTGGSASQNIDDTARSLVKVINQYSGNTSVYAYYISGYTDLPGQIFIEKRSISSSSFSVSVSRSTAWDIGTGTSSNNEYPHGIMWSKIQQPEHVPSSHLEFVGSKSFPIRRIVALRDSLFILKDDGVFRLTGDNGSWNITAVDTSTKILAPDSAVTLNNQIFCLSDQGVVTITDVGVQVISRPIEDQILELIGLNYDNLRKVSFGVGYETDRKYILNTITSSADTYCTRSFVYNVFTNSWTEWDKPMQHAFVNSTDDKLYMSMPGDKRLLKERKSFTYRDYLDEELATVTISSFSTTSVVLDSVSGVSVGDLLYQSSTLYSPITAIDPTTNTVTINDSKTWTLGSATIYKGISCVVEYTNLSMQNPGVDKIFQEVAMLFKEQSFNQATVSFYTDLSGGYADSTIYGQYGGGNWGLFNWGEIPWGGVIRPKPIRLFIPREKSRGTLLSIKFTHRVGYGKFSINGVSVQFDWISERLNRG